MIVNAISSVMKETELGTLPEEWNIGVLSEAFLFSQKPRQLALPDKVPFVPMNLISDEDMEIRNYEIRDFRALTSGTYVEKGDLLVAKITPSFENGKQGILYNMPLGFAYATTEVWPLKAIEGKGDIRFLHYYLKKTDVRQAIALKMEGSTGRQRVPKNVLETLRIPLPKIAEQKKIVGVLGSVREAIEVEYKIIEKTKELKKSLMQKFFTEGLRGEKLKETEIGMIPENWEVVKLGAYARILNGYAFKSDDYVKEGIPLIRISNVSFGFLIDKDPRYLPEQYLEEYKQFALKEGDLILSLTRPVTTGGMKYCFIKKKYLPALLNQRVGKFEIVNAKLLRQYLYHLVFSTYFVGELKTLFGNSSQQPNVSPTQLGRFKVPLPSIDEQLEIGDALDAVNDKIEMAERKLESLKEIFQSMLHQLMTGQIRVKDLDLEVTDE